MSDVEGHDVQAQKVEGSGRDAEGHQDKASESVNDRILKESRKWQARARELEAKLEEIEESKLRQKGEVQKILEKREQELSSLKSALEKKDKAILSSNVMSAVSRFAKDAHDVSDLLKTSQSEMIEYDEETLMPTPDSVKNFVNALREDKPWLFGSQKIPPMGDGAPGEPKTETKSLKKMSKDDIAEAMRKSLSSHFGN